MTKAITAAPRGARRKTIRWRSALRWALLILYLAAAGLEMVTYENSLPSAEPRSLAESLILGLVLAALLLVIVAGVSHLFRRWRVSRGRVTKRPFRRALLSVPVVVVAFVLAVMTRAGAQLEAQQQRAGLAVSDAVSSNPLDRDRGALTAFMVSVPTSELPLARIMRELTAMTKAVGSSSPNLSRLVALAQTASKEARAFATAVAQEPAATPDVREIKVLHQRAANLLVLATTDYVRGFVTRSPKVLRTGDTQFGAFVATLQQTARRADALYQRLGGYGQFGKRIDFQALAQALQQAKSG